MTKWKIYNEDVVEWAKNYQKGKFHALLCDAPYHLTSIVKRFSKKNSAPAQFGSDGVFSRTGAGFMGNTWDGGDLAFRKETWEAFSEVLYPGAFGMAFSSSRNWHRMAVAIEDAGFILHPTIFLWAYGQGFPKATNISKQLEKKGSEDSSIWKGHRYGLQALKPAVEPIIVFQKPYENKPLDDMVSSGAGALNIDGGRIPLLGDDEYSINTFDDGAKPFGDGAGHKFTSRKVESLNGGAYSKNSNRSSLSGDKRNDKGKGMFADGKNTGQEFIEPSGRWPSNLLLTEDSAESLDRQTGELESGKMLSTSKRSTDGSPNGIYGKFDVNHPLQETIGDSGGASRFFFTVEDKLNDCDPVYYSAKVSQKERNAGLESRNVHPTLKPIELCKYLATLLLPPDKYSPRRLFIPFSGVGSEMIGAGLAGWEQICGVEFDTENGYVDIAEKRLQHWLGEKR